MSEANWVAEYMPVIEEALVRRRRSDSWPPMEDLQRWADQRSLGVDVVVAYRAMPTVPGSARWVSPSHFVVPLRFLRYTPSASGLMRDCLLIARRAVEVYLSEVDAPTVRSDDESLRSATDETSDLLLAGQLLQDDAFSPLGGGSYSDQDWEFGVYGPRARRYQGVESVDDYFARQAELAAEFAPNIPTSVGALEDQADPSVDEPVIEDDAEVSYEFDVALSFAGEDRAYVEQIASRLRDTGVNLFFDQDQEVEMWGQDLGDFLDKVYRLRSRFTVMFVSRHYEQKVWTNHERQSALARAVIERGPYVLPVRLDDTDLPGLRPTVAYLDSRRIGSDGLVDAIQRKLSLSTEIVESPLQRVPRTPAEMQAMRDERPPGWEYLLMVGALLHNFSALEQKYLDHELRYAPEVTEHVTASDISEYVHRRSNEAGGIVASMDSLMSPEAQERAFGPSGVAGDPDRIMHLARRLNSIYEGFLDWAASVRGTVVDPQFRPLVEALARFADQPIESYRQFVGDAVVAADQIPSHFARPADEQAAEPLQIFPKLVLDVPADISAAFAAEFDRLKSG